MLPKKQVKEKEEDFPLLPVKKDCASSCSSRRSSVSSLSSVSSSALSTTQKKGGLWTLALTQDAVCRTRVFCKCAKCKRGPGFLPKQKWNNLESYPCQNAFPLERGIVCKVLHERDYGRQGAVLIHIASQNGSGWVFPECLGGLKKARESLFQRNVAVNLSLLKKETKERMQNKKRATRKQYAPPRAPTPLKPVAPAPSKYQFKEFILCRMRLGSPWMPAEVECVKPLTIKPQGWDQSCAWDERNTKKFPTSKFVAVQDLAVRTSEDPKSFVKANISQGETFGVVQMKGFFGRITEPVCGWVDMRTDSGLNALEVGYKFQRVEPTVFFGNLPSPVSKAAVYRGIQYLGEGFMPTRIQIFCQGNNSCAKISLNTNVAASQMASRSIMVNDRVVKGSLCIDYLRSKAGMELNLKESEI